jgi:hypothetical protein
MRTYINITITYYTRKGMEPDVHYYRNDGVHPITSTFNKLTLMKPTCLCGSW